jgi:hypothetical protein
LPADERAIAAALQMRAGASLNDAELTFCRAVVQPGAGPLGWRARLRLAILATRHPGNARS